MFCILISLMIKENLLDQGGSRVRFEENGTTSRSTWAVWGHPLDQPVFFGWSRVALENQCRRADIFSFCYHLFL